MHHAGACFPLIDSSGSLPGFLGNFFQQAIHFVILLAIFYDWYLQLTLVLYAQTPIKVFKFLRHGLDRVVNISGVKSK